MPAMSSRAKYDDQTEEYFALVRCLPNQPPPNAIAHGPRSAMLPEKAFTAARAEAKHLRADAAEVTAIGKALQDELSAMQSSRENLANVVADAVRTLGRLNARMDAIEEEQREQARYDKEPIEPPPGEPATEVDEEDPAATKSAPEPVAYDFRTHELVNAGDEDLPMPPPVWPTKANRATCPSSNLRSLLSPRPSQCRAGPHSHSPQPSAVIEN